MSIWNSIVRDVTRERRLSLVETARAFVLVNVSIHDALQTTQTSKFVYGLWRPVTAIRQADPNLHPGITPDPTWLPLLGTPPYPSYAGNMATTGASAARALQLVFGTNDIPVTATWHQAGGLPDVASLRWLLAGGTGAVRAASTEAFTTASIKWPASRLESLLPTSWVPTS